MPNEPTPKAGIGASRAFSVDGYGFETWGSLFTDATASSCWRTLFSRDSPRFWQACGTCTVVSDPPQRDVQVHRQVRRGRGARRSPRTCSCAAISQVRGLQAARSAHMAATSGEKIRRNTFARFALPMVWDYCEVNPARRQKRLAASSGLRSIGSLALSNIADTAVKASAPASVVDHRSAAVSYGTDCRALRPDLH